MIENGTNVAIDEATKVALQQIESGNATLVQAPKKVSGKEIGIRSAFAAGGLVLGGAAGYAYGRYRSYKKLKDQVLDIEDAVSTLAEEVVALKGKREVEDEEYFEVEDEPEETPQQPEKKADKKADDKK